MRGFLIVSVSAVFLLLLLALTATEAAERRGKGPPAHVQGGGNVRHGHGSQHTDRGGGNRENNSGGHRGYGGNIGVGIDLGYWGDSFGIATEPPLGYRSTARYFVGPASFLPAGVAVTQQLSPFGTESLTPFEATFKFAGTQPPALGPATPTVNASWIATNNAARDYQAAAERDFRHGSWPQALRNANHAIVEDPENGKLWLFHAQILFAQGDYSSSSASLRRGTSLLNAGQWGGVVENYEQFYTGQSYQQQMKVLDEYLQKNPKDADAHLIRGYQYLYLGEHTAADRSLSQALDIRDDALTRRLWNRAQPRDDEPLAPTPFEILPPPQDALR